jgi:regulator of RNase E activity RraA
MPALKSVDYTERLAGAGACDVSDACDQLGCPAVRTGAIRPAYPGCRPIAGAVMTVTLTPGQGLPLGALLDALSQAAGDIVLADLGGRTDLQCWGLVLATAAVACGKRAAIVNGAVRDVADLASLAFPTYSRGVHPASMRGRLAFAGTDLGVDIDGATVPPGSAVAADESGIVFFPRSRADEVLSLARDIARDERALLARVGTVDDHTAALKLLRH